MRGGATISVLLVLLAGCANPATEASYRILDAGANSPYTGPKAIALIQDEAAWTTWWADHGVSRPPTIAFPFEEEDLILVFQGRQPSGGYHVEVTDYRVVHFDHSGPMGHVSLTFFEPGPGCGVTHALTEPYVFLAVDKITDLMVTEKTELSTCGP